MFEKEIYSERRQNLIQNLSGGVALFLGNLDSPMNYSANPYRFRQDSSFLYFFGIDDPGLVVIIDIDSGKEYLFGNEADIEDFIWTGKQDSLSDKAKKAGIAQVFSINELSGFIKKIQNKKRRIHFLPPYRAENNNMLSELLNIPFSQIENLISIELIKAIVNLRSIKDNLEIEELKKAAKTGFQMHITAMKMANPGISEQEIAGIVEGIALSSGGMPSFPLILSQHGEILHNLSHSEILKKGKLLLMDGGAETALHYASDFTRVTPVGGKFTEKQKEIYKIVFAANEKARELIKPGITYISVHLSVCEVIAEGLYQLGLMKGDVKDAVHKGAHALFFPHGLGHMLGLDVHDMEDLGQIYVGYDDEIQPVDQFGTGYLRLGRRLKERFVLTNEPGIYFNPLLIEKWESEKIHTDFINYKKLAGYLDFGGIRLEDNIIVTKTGNQLIGDRIPITIEDVEKIASD